MGNQHGRSWDQVGRKDNQDGRNDGYLPGKGQAGTGSLRWKFRLRSENPLCCTLALPGFFYAILTKFSFSNLSEKGRKRKINDMVYGRIAQFIRRGVIRCPV